MLRHLRRMATASACMLQSSRAGCGMCACACCRLARHLLNVELRCLRCIDMPGCALAGSGSNLPLVRACQAEQQQTGVRAPCTQAAVSLAKML